MRKRKFSETIELSPDRFISVQEVPGGGANILGIRRLVKMINLDKDDGKPEFNLQRIFFSREAIEVLHKLLGEYLKSTYRDEATDKADQREVEANKLYEEHEIKAGRSPEKSSKSELRSFDKLG